MKEGFLVHPPYEDVFEYDDYSTLNSILKNGQIHELDQDDSVVFLHNNRLIIRDLFFAFQDIRPYPVITMCKKKTIVCWYQGFGCSIPYYTSTPIYGLLSSFFAVYPDQSVCDLSLLYVRDNVGHIYTSEYIIPFEGFKEGVMLTLFATDDEIIKSPKPDNAAVGISVTVRSDFCSKEIILDMTPVSMLIRTIVKCYLDVMIKDVHCIDETDCNVFLNEMERELDLNSTLEKNMIDYPCCLLIQRKVQNPHTSRKTNKLVVCSDIVTGETVYLTLRYINIPILQNAILGHSKLPNSVLFSAFTSDGIPIPESGFKEVSCDAPTSIVYFRHVLELPPPFTFHSMKILSQISHDCFMIEFKKTEMQLWLKNLKNYWTFTGSLLPILDKASHESFFSDLHIVTISCGCEMIETYPALPVMGDVILKAYSLSIPYKFLLAEGVYALLTMLSDKQRFPQLQRVIVDTS